jgi:hypothetical protein
LAQQPAERVRGTDRILVPAWVQQRQLGRTLQEPALDRANTDAKRRKLGCPLAHLASNALSLLGAAKPATGVAALPWSEPPRDLLLHLHFFSASVNDEALTPARILGASSRSCKTSRNKASGYGCRKQAGTALGEAHGKGEGEGAITAFLEPG